uniref:HK97 gp10 family phage protein n=1 Tax=Enterocloster clostridioformis TaxID=1531 RepID=UPI0025A5BD58|nr:HK97 gp10 family phage protein [Enterocloster clostridioformis]
MGRIKPDQLADEVMRQLEEFADSTADGMRAAVRKAGDTVRSEIKSGAPVRSGAYSKSWSVKSTKESSHAFEVTVYSRNRYQLAHLLEHGHAKRGGGRVSGRAHIAPAEESGIRQLEQEIERSIRRNG